MNKREITNAMRNLNRLGFFTREVDGQIQCLHASGRNFIMGDGDDEIPFDEYILSKKE